MKKIIVMTSIALLYAANAMAVTATTGNGASEATEAIWATDPSRASIAKASKNVRFGWNTISTSYTLDTWHTSGTKCYGSGSDSTKIFFKDCDSTTFAAPTSSVGSDIFVEGTWTPM